jgi:hypothetical protein
MVSGRLLWLVVASLIVLPFAPALQERSAGSAENSAAALAKAKATYAGAMGRLQTDLRRALTAARRAVPPGPSYADELQRFEDARTKLELDGEWPGLLDDPALLHRHADIRNSLVQAYEAAQVQANGRDDLEEVRAIGRELEAFMRVTHLAYGRRQQGALDLGVSPGAWRWDEEKEQLHSPIIGSPKDTPRPLIIKAKPVGVTDRFELRFTVDSIEEGFGLTVRLTGSDGARNDWHIDRSQLASGGVAIVATCVDEYSKLEIDGRRIARTERNGAGDELDAPGAAPSPWLAIVPDKGTHLVMENVLWRPLAAHSHDATGNDAVCVGPCPFCRPRADASSPPEAKNRRPPEQTEVEQAFPRNSQWTGDHQGAATTGTVSSVEGTSVVMLVETAGLAPRHYYLSVSKGHVTLTANEAAGPRPDGAPGNPVYNVRVSGSISGRTLVLRGRWDWHDSRTKRGGSNENMELTLTRNR